MTLYRVSYRFCIAVHNLCISSSNRILFWELSDDLPFWSFYHTRHIFFHHILRSFLISPLLVQFIQIDRGGCRMSIIYLQRTVILIIIHILYLQRAIISNFFQIWKKIIGLHNTAWIDRILTMATVCIITVVIERTTIATLDRIEIPVDYRVSHRLSHLAVT